LIAFHQFENESAQADWVTHEIKKNLEADELRHDDIVVINPDPLTTRQNVGPIRRRLLDVGISSHLAGVDTDPDIFFHSDTNSVTFTGIFRAKGNEAGMVYIVNAQDCDSSAWNLATIRNRLFTAITRSKAWVRVLGIGDGMKALAGEYGKLKAHNFELHFTYPTKPQLDKMKTVHRDMSTAERKRLKDRERGLSDLVAELETGSVHPEDLDEQLVSKLRDLLSKKK
jgi:superfamily I DNA and RNA helicase